MIEAAGGAEAGARSPLLVAPLRALAAETPLTVRIAGGSMRPAIPDGARVTVRAGRCLPGDVAAFRGRDGRLRVHRVLGWLPGRGGPRLFAKGDAAGTRDPSAAAADLLGCVESVDGVLLAVRPSARARALAALAAAVLCTGLRRLRRR